MTGSTVRLLHEEHFMKLYGELTNWRIDDFQRQMENLHSKGRVLPFVRGLRLSAQLIHITREILAGSKLTADWGHLLDSSGTICSCEADVIIHKGGYIRRWNGGANHVMDFRFIEQSDAVAVISCKSHVQSAAIDTDYPGDMAAFCTKVWLFAECCGPRSIASVRSNATAAGYNKTWVLYTWSTNSAPEANKPDWLDFVSEVRTLKGLYP